MTDAKAWRKILRLGTIIGLALIVAGSLGPEPPSVVVVLALAALVVFWMLEATKEKS